MLLLLGCCGSGGFGSLVTPRRPAAATWRKTLCGTPSSVQPRIPAGEVEVGTDYPGNDIPPCNVGGCVLLPNATAADCKARCAQASLCVGYVFAPGGCSGGAGPRCYTKASLEHRVPDQRCRVSQAIGYPGDNGTEIHTRWTNQVSGDTAPLPEYPRPQMVRTPPSLAAAAGPSYATLRETGDPSNWQSLNGLWEWEAAKRAPAPFGKTLNGSILVPFPYESCLSGVVSESECYLQPQTMWYNFCNSFFYLENRFVPLLSLLAPVMNHLFWAMSLATSC